MLSFKSFTIGDEYDIETYPPLPLCYRNHIETHCTICYAHAGLSRITAIMYIVTQA
jgi:hypothetical protein